MTNKRNFYLEQLDESLIDELALHHGIETKSETVRWSIRLAAILTLTDEQTRYYGLEYLSHDTGTTLTD